MLLGCAADPGSPVDTSRGEDSAETPYDEPWCGELSEPLEIDDPDDVLFAMVQANLSIVGFTAQYDWIEAWASTEGCPVQTVDGGTVVYEGGCSSERIDASGRLTVQDDGDQVVYSYEAFSFTLDDSEFFEADGSLTVVRGDGSAYSALLTYAFASDDGGGNLEPGTWTYALDGALDGEEYYWYQDGYVHAAPESEDTSGDFCFHIEVVEVPSCSQEWDYTVAAYGTASGVLRFDGSLACDGCGTFTLDGVEEPHCY